MIWKKVFFRAAALSWGRAAKDGRAGAVEMSAKNICLTDGTGRSIGVSLFCACAMRRFVKKEPAKKPLLTRGCGAEKLFGLAFDQIS